MTRSTTTQPHECARHPTARRRATRLAWLAILGTCGGAAAQTLELVDFSAQRAQVIAQLERVPAIELQQRHLRCMHVSSVRNLTIGETTICALVSDALRERAFAGDHRAMAAWAASQRDPHLALLEP